MKAHTKVYMDHFDYGIDDVILCEIPGCNKRCVDIHHILYRSLGGSDDIDNLIGLCREHHIDAHEGKILRVDLRAMHYKFMGNL